MITTYKNKYIVFLLDVDFKLPEKNTPILDYKLIEKNIVFPDLYSILLLAENEEEAKKIINKYRPLAKIENIYLYDKSKKIIDSFFPLSNDEVY